jgi:hypothetical protein
MWARERAGLLALSGLAWGLTTLTKPQALILPVIFILADRKSMSSMKSVRSSLRAGVIVYAVLSLTVAPWLMRNYTVFGKPVICNTGGINLLDGNNPYATGRKRFDEKVNSLLGDLRTVPLEFMFDGKEVERDELAAKIGMDYIIHNPLRTIALWPKKFVALYLSDVDGIFYSLWMMDVPREKLRYAFTGTRIIAEVYYIFIILLFLVSVPTFLRERKLIGLAIIAYFTLISLVLFGNARYHFPIMPWVIIYSGIGGEILLAGQRAIRTEDGGKPDG